MSLATGTFRPRGRKPRIPIMQPRHRLNEGLLARWLMVEGAGGLRDFGPNAIPTQTFGGAWTHGPHGPAWDISSGEDNYAFIGRPSVLQITYRVTVAAWFKVRVTSGQQSVVAKRNTGNYPIHLYARDTSGLIAVHGWVVDPGTPNTSRQNYTVAGPITEPHRWYHAAATLDHGLVRLYVDGEMSGEELLDWPMLQQNPHDWHIGRTGSNQANFQPLLGVLSDVGIWSRALSPDEIQELSMGLYEEFTPPVRRPMVVVPQMPSVHPLYGPIPPFESEVLR